MGDQERVPDGLTDDELLAKLGKLEAEGVELRMALKRRQIQPKAKSFADLRGIFAGRMKVTDEDLAAAEYHFAWEGETVT